MTTIHFDWKLKAAGAFAFAIVLISTGCRTTGPASQLQSSDVVAGSVTPPGILTECPPYVFDPALDADVSTPKGNETHPGLPLDVRDKSETLDPYGFGCYGACGPSCKVDWDKEWQKQVKRTYKVRYADGKTSCRACTYNLRRARSNIQCRLHDDCYRQTDLGQFSKTLGDLRSGLSTLSLSGYRICDLGPARDQSLKGVATLYFGAAFAYATGTEPCWTDWMQGYTPDRCWDQTYSTFATLADEAPAEGSCDDATEYARPSGSQAIQVHLPARGYPGSKVSAPFEEIRARCTEVGARLPTIQELQKLVAAAPLAADIGNQECLWSQSSSPDFEFSMLGDKDARMALNLAARAPKVVGAASTSCAGLCVVSGSQALTSDLRQIAGKWGAKSADFMFADRKARQGELCHRDLSGWTYTDKAKQECEAAAPNVGQVEGVQDALRQGCLSRMEAICRNPNEDQERSIQNALAFEGSRLYNVGRYYGCTQCVHSSYWSSTETEYTDCRSCCDDVGTNLVGNDEPKKRSNLVTACQLTCGVARTEGIFRNYTNTAVCDEVKEMSPLTRVYRRLYDASTAEEATADRARISEQLTKLRDVWPQIDALGAGADNQITIGDVDMATVADQRQPVRASGEFLRANNYRFFKLLDSASTGDGIEDYLISRGDLDRFIDEMSEYRTNAEF